MKIIAENFLCNIYEEKGNEREKIPTDILKIALA